MTLTSWDDLRPGTIITVKTLYNRRSYKLRVAKVHTGTTAGLSAESAYAWLAGHRLRMDGTPSRRRPFMLLGVEGRQELVHQVPVHMSEVTALEPSPELVAAAWAEHRARRTRNADGRRARGTSNGNSRGGSKDRRRRKAWLLATFGDGEKATGSFDCGAVLTSDTVSVDRYPIPGAQGGTYARGNIRPVCGRCNSVHGATVRRA